MDACGALSQSRRRETFIPSSLALAFLIMLGVATLIIVMAVMKFRTQLIDRSLGQRHIIVQPVDGKRRLRGCIGGPARCRAWCPVIPLVEGQAL